ncbi:GyrI-like domain-containing protein [Anaerosolibacter sp.]|uniref:GyrI-like domain-containing protein n=1 Tax=Anaerosolibacter sp. TaxID=1872527 RepID=UPI0039F0C687
MKKVDYKTDSKDIYLPKKTPVIVTVPTISYIMIDGEGDPNGEAFAQATAALYSFSYAVKMSYKSKDVPKGYYDYIVFPLEGVWDLLDYNLSHTDKNNLKYTIMIRQPDFLTMELFQRFIEETTKKKPNPYLHKIEYRTVTEGLCCQMLHMGSYDNEPESFKQMEKFCQDNGYTRISLTHKEIYLSDPRKTEPNKLKTVLRFQVEVK